MNQQNVRNDLGTWIDDEHRRGILLEYLRLASRPELSDPEANRLDEILCEAESDRILNFLLQEVDCILGQRLNLLDKEHVESYENEQAWLREYLGNQSLEEFTLYRGLQKRLKEQGYYEGPQDGVFGEDSKKAIEKLLEHTKKPLAFSINPDTQNGGHSDA